MTARQLSALLQAELRVVGEDQTRSSDHAGMDSTDIVLPQLVGPTGKQLVAMPGAIPWQVLADSGDGISRRDGAADRDVVAAVTRHGDGHGHAGGRWRELRA